MELLIAPTALRAVRGRPTDAQVRKVMQIALERQSELLQAWSKHHG